MYAHKLNISFLYFLALSLLVISLPLSRYLMSVSQFILVGIWLWDGINKEKFIIFLNNNPKPKIILLFLPIFFVLIFKNLISKFKIFISNKPAFIFSSLYLLHIIGLIYTSDFNYAFKDLRTKLPLLILPLIISTTKGIDRKNFHRLMLLFVGAVFAGTIASIYVLFQNQITDIREISPFISHIRFSLDICIAIFTLVYFIYEKNTYNFKIKIIFCVIIAYLILYLIILESVTGIVILIITSLILFVSLAFKERNKYLKLVYLGIFVGIPLLLFIYVKNCINEYTHVAPVDFSKLEKYTSRGNPYVNDTINYGVENGKYVGLYISYKELKQAWNKRSKYDFDGKDKKNQNIKFTLIRFLNSLGYHKDADGVNKLTDKQIHYIEDGIANVNYLKTFNLNTRIYQAIIGYNNYKFSKNPNRSSALQRLEYWKTSIEIIKDNWLIGVGTGDMNIAFTEQYKKMHSLLQKQYRLRSHNQYLSILVGFGILGFIWFMITLFYPPFKTRKIHDYFFFTFFIIILLSMLTEDTIESQAGITFYAFFGSFFMFGRKK